MKKVLIVDDEYYFRQGFKKMIPWTDYGYEVYAEAKNGQEALEIITNSRPDLVFLDISMPIMNGMELMKCLYDRADNTPVVLLTGYSEFEYARQAVRYGAKEYLLKPVEASDVCELLEELLRQPQPENGVMQADEADSYTLGIIKDKLFIDMVSGDFDLEKEKLFNHIAKISFSAANYRIAVFRLVKQQDWSSADLRLWKYGASNIIQELAGDSLGCGLFYIAETDICGVLWEKENKTELEDGSLKAKCIAIARLIYDKLGIRVYAGIGSRCSQVSQIKASYHQAREAVNSKLLVPEAVILYSDVMDRSDDVSIFGVDEKRRLLSSIYMFDKGAICSIIHAVFDRLEASCASMNVVNNVISEFSSILSEAGQHIRNVSPQYGAAVNPQLDFKQCNTMAEVCVLVEQTFLSVSEKIMQARPAMSTAQKAVEKTKAYIEHEYHRSDLSEEEISKNMYLTRNYLCSIFKKSTGVTIGKYIDEIRLRKAKELFQAGNTVIADVSEKVGFCDANYFGKFFKKKTGLTPSQYLNTVK